MKKFILTISLIIMLTLGIVGNVAFATGPAAGADEATGSSPGGGQEEVNPGSGQSETCAHNVGPNGESCVIPPTIPKPRLLPGPSEADNSGLVYERYFITDLLPTLIRGAVNLLGGITILALMYGGIQYLTSFGDDTKNENAKRTIIFAIVGLLIAIFSYTIVSIVSETPLSNRGEFAEGVTDETLTAE
ncbi:hypothetical protein HOG48_04410 [Candidatus Peregrinibacteria bacterium]|jgi:hypothetical protein|nr:hypothetical protein [Candidatus Peregrinibacteria bacterium]